MKVVKDLRPVIGVFSESQFQASENRDASSILSLLSKLKLGEEKASKVEKLYHTIAGAKQNGVSEHLLSIHAPNIPEDEIDSYLRLLVTHNMVVLLNDFNEHRYYSIEHSKRFQDNENQTKETLSLSQSKLTTFTQLEKKDNVIGNPWAKYNGEADIHFIHSLRRKLLSVIMLNPGISEVCL